MGRENAGTAIAHRRAMSEETPGIVDRAPEQAVEVLETSMHIHHLCIERASIVTYLGKIAPEKQAIAHVHALDVGVTELIARRERFQR